MLLRGVRVLDVSRLLPGGYCTQLLQQQGAHVIKVESPAGDPIRGLPGGEAFFDALHRDKELVRLDLRTDDGRRSFGQRVAEADVLVEGFRPGVMERMQLGYDALAAINPGLVYCAITGYGSTSKLASRAGHDLNYLARSGALSLMPRADGRPMIPGLQVADLAGGVQAAFLIVAALADRARTGRGARVEVSMIDLMRSWTALPRAARHAGLEGLPLTGELPCYHVYAVSDGFLTVAALEADFWAEFCRAIGREDLTRRQFDASAVDDVQRALQPLSQDEWARRLEGRDVCVEPVLSLEESEAD
ncbi:MAG TPA: CoA transferase [Candidatus Dormibacteraeota bacterium]|nr:CoA transferase [Candidatus Dormibacteraeota bacterium]